MLFDDIKRQGFELITLRRDRIARTHEPDALPTYRAVEARGGQSGTFAMSTGKIRAEDKHNAIVLNIHFKTPPVHPRCCLPFFLKRVFVITRAIR